MMSTTRHPTQVALLALIRMYVASNGYSPSVRELAQAVGCSIDTAHYHLCILRKGGMVTWVDRRTRSIRLVEK